MTAFEIWWEGPWPRACGGIRALRTLCSEIESRGFRASLATPARFGGMREAPDDVIGIYPQGVRGNPAGYQKRVRWMLNKASHVPGVLTYAWEAGMGDYPLLTVDIVERELWCPRTGPRSCVGWYLGKGIGNLSVLPAGAIKITREWPTTREELAALIGSLDYLISFDSFSILNVEAVCAGTPVVLLDLSETWSPEDLDRHGWLRYGVARSIDTLDDARASVGVAFDHYDQMRQVFARRIDGFLEHVSTI